jgi:hypothetical protein
MEPIVVAVGCGAAGAASDLKINPPRLIKKGLWEQRYARVLRQRRPVYQGAGAIGFWMRQTRMEAA